MSTTVSVTFTWAELEEVRIALEVQIRARRTDEATREEGRQVEAIERALRKVRARIEVAEANAEGAQ